MLFGEKYGNEVRVLSMGDGFSVELCGGTHVDRTGDIGLMKIVAESGIAAGVRRIEAVTGAAALALIERQQNQLNELAGLLKTAPDRINEKVMQILEQQRQQEKQLSQMKARLASSAGSDLSAEVRDCAGIKVLARAIEGADAKTLRDTVDQLKNKLGSAVIVLAAAEGDKVMLTAGVTRDLTDRFKAGDLMQQLAAQVGGKGGGRPDMAQGGGSDPAALPAALDFVYEWVERG